jgi:hypothetical protein
MRQTATAEMRLDEGKATSSSTAKRATRRIGFEQRQLRSISLRLTRMSRKITLNNPGIWGMSAEGGLVMNDAVAPTLSSVTADLVPTPGTSADALDRARRAAAVAEITGQQIGFLTRSSIIAAPPPSVASVQAFGSLINQLRATPLAAERVVRREFATRLSPDPRVGPTPDAGQAPSSTLGPFLDAFNRPVLIDVFSIPARVAVQRAGAAQPFLYVELPPPSGIGSTLTLGAGSVWIPAPALGPGVPASGFVGLRIKSGTVSFGTTVPLGVSPIVVPATATVTIALTLDPATASTGSGPGADARAAPVSTPDKVTFTFTTSGANLTGADDASLTAFGTTLKLKHQLLPAHYDPVFGRVDFPYAQDRPDFAVAASHSTLATFAGQAVIFGAAWSLPITLAGAGSLGAAAGAGGVAIGLVPGLTVQWTGRDAPADCGACVLLVEPGLLAVGGFTARAPNVAQPIGLSTSSTLRITTPGVFPFRFTSDATGQESWAFIPLLVATFDQPRTVNNARARLAGPALIVLQQTSTGIALIVEAAASQAVQGSVQSYAIKNLLLKASDPLTLLVVASLSGATADGGAAVLQFNLRLVLPILPDPYATNLAFDPRRAIDSGVIGTLTLLLRWQPAQKVVLDLLLPAGAMQTVSVATPAPRPPPAENDAQALSEMQALFDRAAPGFTAGPTLLDLSTNVSQFGVAFGTATFVGAPAPPAQRNLSIANLLLQGQVDDLRVVTLPAVQWEPVLTPDQTTPFPSPLTYADSGGPIALAAASVTLVPIAPRPAIDALLAAYEASSPVAARFTLPFGIVAIAELQRSKLPIIPSPTLVEVQPNFSAAGLRGGDQISIQAARPPLPFGGFSPSLPGAAFQLHNARAFGLPAAVTVLTPIDDTFNSNFGPATATPRVPVTRIDISGFGESLFSDWRNPVDAAATISKARFDVFVGRTAREVVQAFSVLYPYAVRVVRTITIERQNGAAVVRHDSGWQPVSNGLYLYPKPDLITHPGVVRAAVAVTNIRDTGQRHTTPDGSELMAVRFDCALTMENAVLGDGPDGVPALDQLGYVQLTDPPAHGQLAPDQYAELLDAVGPLGGPIDCTIDIGGTGQRMRISTVGVAHSPGIGGQEFVMAAWGSPVLPGGGQWSFVRQAAADPAPQAVDRDQGVPLVRAGAATAAPPANSPYRFADPSDLLHPDSPHTDYGLLHATGTQRLIFPRPKLEAIGPHAVTSVRAPVLADPFALATATGPFPRIEACIPFPNASYSLAIGAGGNFTLQPAPFEFTTPVLKRVLRESTTVRSIAYTADENNTPSVVTLEIDTAAADPWSVSITNLSLATESGSLGEVTRVVGTIDSKPGAPTQLANSRFVFGPPLKPVAALVSFLEQFSPLPPLGVAMTNDLSLQAGITFDLPKYLGQLSPAVKAFLERFIADLDVKMLSKTTPMSSSFVMQFELTVKIPTPFTIGVATVVAIGLAKVQFQMGDDGNAWTFQLGCGIGVEFPVIGFKALAYYAQSQFLITGDTVFGLGASSLVKGSIDLEIVEVGLSIEAKIALLRVTCNVSDSSIWGVAQVTIAVEVSIFFVIDIEFDVQAEWTNNFDGGPCALPDVV